MPVRLRYIFSEALAGLWRNLVVTTATILTVTITLTMLGAGLLVQRQFNLAQRVLYADVEVSIFLTDAITPSQQESLQSDLAATDVVDQVIFESKDQAYANALEIFADEPNILGSLSPEILPASFRVKLDDPEQYDVVASLFQGRPGIEDIVDQREVLEEFFSVMGLLRGFSIALACVAAVAAVLLIATTIRLTAYARREQISIMKLVGATNWYIRLPFMMEAVVASILGALIGGGLLLLSERALIRPRLAPIEFLPVVGSADVLAIFPLLLIGSAVVAAGVSVLALWRTL